MNDIERAIKQFKEWEKDRWRLGKSPSIPTLILARQALEKQTPKEIIYDYGLNETRCPRCNTIFGYAYEEDETEDMYYAPYCYECGQCLDWEVENE
jgi:hypothetical protein